MKPNFLLGKCSKTHVYKILVNKFLRRTQDPTFKGNVADGRVGDGGKEEEDRMFFFVWNRGNRKRFMIVITYESVWHSLSQYVYYNFIR